MARKNKPVTFSLPPEILERLEAEPGGRSQVLQTQLRMAWAVQDFGLRQARRTLTPEELDYVRLVLQGSFFDYSQLPLWLTGQGLVHQVRDALGDGGDLEGVDEAEARALVQRLESLDALAQLSVIVWATRREAR